MPTYIYMCKTCGNTVDITLSYSEYDTFDSVPECHGKKMVQSYTQPEIIYRGTGWTRKDGSVEENNVW